MISVVFSKHSAKATALHALPPWSGIMVQQAETDHRMKRPSHAHRETRHFSAPVSPRLYCRGSSYLLWAPTPPPQHSPKSGVLHQSLIEDGLRQWSSPLLPSQTRRLSKRFRPKASPTPSPVSVPVYSAPPGPRRIFPSSVGAAEVVHFPDEHLSPTFNICKLHQNSGPDRVCVKRFLSRTRFLLPLGWCSGWSRSAIRAMV